MPYAFPFSLKSLFRAMAWTLFSANTMVCPYFSFRQCIQILNAFQRLDSQMFCKLYIGVAVNKGRRCENALFYKGIEVSFVHNIICKDLL